MSNTESSRARSLISAWWLPAILAAVLVAHVGALVSGGALRIAAWYLLLSSVPLVGALYLVGALARVAWKRRLTRATGATVPLSLVAITPITWSLRLWPVAFLADIDSTEPALAIRVPTNEPMRVGWGGDSAATNLHAMTSDQRWAYDLVIEPYFTGSQRLEDYGCYGVPVVAPIAGEVVQAMDGEPDVQPGPPANPAAPYGNHVVISPGGGGHLIIAHLKSGSLAVEAGDRIEEGQVIGACGNSGNTSEPHVGGARMPRGGLDRDGARLIALGDVIRHGGNAAEVPGKSRRPSSP